MRFGVTLYLLCSMMLGLGTRAAAQAPESADARDRAISLAERAGEAYDDGEVALSISLLEEALSLFREPSLLYSLARAHEALGNLESALEAYEAYRAEGSTGQRGAVLDQRIASLREQIAREEELEASLSEQRLRAEQAEQGSTSSASPWTWVLIGVGLATLGTAVGLGVHAESEAEVGGGLTGEQASRQLSSAEDFAAGANISFAVGGGIALAGAVGWLVQTLSAD